MQMQAPDFTCKGAHPSIGKRDKQSRNKKTKAVIRKVTSAGGRAAPREHLPGPAASATIRTSSLCRRHRASLPRRAQRSRMPRRLADPAVQHKIWRGSDAGAIVMVAGSAATAHKELHAEMLPSHPVFGHGKHIGQLQRRRLRMCRGAVWSGAAGAQACDAVTSKHAHDHEQSHL